jgi:hypothetical protein
LGNGIRGNSNKKKKKTLIDDLESTGQPAVTEAAEAAPLWEQQLINICREKNPNSNKQYSELLHCAVTPEKKRLLLDCGQQDH